MKQGEGAKGVTPESQRWVMPVISSSFLAFGTSALRGSFISLDYSRAVAIRRCSERVRARRENPHTGKPERELRLRSQCVRIRDAGVTNLSNRVIGP